MNDPAHPRDFTADGKVIPDRQDYEAIERDFADTKNPAELYRLAQAHKLVRLFGGRGPNEPSAA